MYLYSNIMETHQFTSDSLSTDVCDGKRRDEGFPWRLAYIRDMGHTHFHTKLDLIKNFL